MRSIPAVQFGKIVCIFPNSSFSLFLSASPSLHLAVVLSTTKIVSFQSCLSSKIFFTKVQRIVSYVCPCVCVSTAHALSLVFSNIYLTPHRTYRNRYQSTVCMQHSTCWRRIFLLFSSFLRSLFPCLALM